MNIKNQNSGAAVEKNEGIDLSASPKGQRCQGLNSSMIVQDSGIHWSRLSDKDFPTGDGIGEHVKIFEIIFAPADVAPL
jgi:hypothetical protein